MTYRESDADRALHAEREREVAAWIDTLEATRIERDERPRRFWLLWTLIGAGPCLGALVAWIAALASGVEDVSALLVIGGSVGFVVGAAVAFRLALVRPSLRRRPEVAGR